MNAIDVQSPESYRVPHRIPLLGLLFHVRTFGLTRFAITETVALKPSLFLEVNWVNTNHVRILGPC